MCVEITGNVLTVVMAFTSVSADITEEEGKKSVLLDITWQRGQREVSPLNDNRNSLTPIFKVLDSFSLLVSYSIEDITNKRVTFSVGILIEGTF